MKKLFAIFFTLIVIILLLIILIAGLLTTTAGSKFLAKTASQLDPNIELNEVDGNILDGLDVQEVKWEGEDETKITATDVTVKADYTQLENKTAQIKTLEIDSLDVSLPESEESTPISEIKLPPIPLPLDIKAEKIQLKQLNIQQGKITTVIKNIASEFFTKDGVLNIQKLSLTPEIEGANIQLDATGTVDLKKNYQSDLNISTSSEHSEYGKLAGDINVKGQLDDFNIRGNIDTTSPEYGRAKGDIKITGKIENYRINSQLEIDSKNYGKQNLTVKGTGTPETLNIDTLNISGSEGKLAATGKINWLPNIRWDLSLKPEQLKTDKLLKDWPATLTGNIKTKGELKDDKPDIDIDIKSLTGKFQGYPLKAQGKVFLKKDVLSLEKLNVTSGDNKIFANGQASEPFNLEWDINAKKLSQLHKDLAGSIKGKGTLKGTLEKLQIQAQVSGNKLRYTNYQANTLNADISQSGNTYTIKADAKQLLIDSNKIKSLNIDGKGSLEKHQASIKLAHQEGNANLALAGTWKNEQWKGTLKSLDLLKTAAGNWKLSNPVSISASKNKAELSKMCLTQTGASVCSTTKWTAKNGANATGSIKNLPLTLLKPWLPDTIKANGRANADYTFKQVSGKPDLTATIRLPDDRLQIKLADGSSQTLNYQNTTADIRLKGDKLTSNVGLKIKNRGDISSKMDVTLRSNKPPALKGNVKFTIPSITWVDEFVPEISKPQGNVAGNFLISGTSDNPIIGGQAQLSNGQLYLPQTGVTLKQITLRLQANQSRNLAISGSLQSGAGKLNASGTLSLQQLPKWKADVTLKGNNLDFMNTHEMRGVISPDLSIQASADAVNITGSLTIPKTDIALNELPATAVAESDDVIIVGRENSKQQTAKEVPFKINPNVVIRLGDNVKFSGFGLDTKLQGNFRIYQRNKILLADGNVKVVDGIYEAYGQNLTIEKGELIFNGPVDDPGVNIRAVREVSEGTVGIQLQGTLQVPESTIFSTPTMAQSEALSFLLTGRRLDSASGAESAILTQAIQRLGIAGGESLIRQIGTQLGLDEVSINTGDTIESSELALGKRLGPNLYLKYIVGLFDSLQRVAINYRINKRLQLEAESGKSPGFDFIYQYDKD